MARLDGSGNGPLETIGENAGYKTATRGEGAVAGASAVIAGVAGLAKLAGFLRDRSLGIAFGAGSESDAYLVATWLPPLLVAVIVSAVNTSLLPVFTELRVRGENRAAWRLVSAVLNLAVVVSGALMVAGLVWAGDLARLVAPGFDEATTATTALLLKITMPCMVFLTLHAVGSTVLHSFRCFAPPAAGAVLVNAATIAAIVFGAGRWGIGAVALGTVTGYALQAVLLAPFLRGRWGHYSTSLGLRDPNVRRVLVLAAPVTAVAALSQVSGVIEKYLASGLSAGSIAALTFASKLIMLPTGLFAIAVSTVVFPVMAEAASRGDLESVNSSVQRGTRILVYVTLPAVVGLSALRYPVVQALFEKGAFGPEATEATALAVLCYSASMLFKSVEPVFGRAFHAMQDTLTPSAITLAGVPLFGVTAVLLSGPLGHAGIALATSLSSAVVFAVNVALLRRRHHVSPGVTALSSFVLRLVIPCGVMAGVSFAALAAARAIGVGRAIAMLSAVGAGAVAYFVATLVTGVKEARDAVRVFRTVARKVATVAPRSAAH
ncbi:MAG: murein biosynthesis integral membrane protein MurJ [Firmicutes bacterium]|nr:murein biosynthesis integral membrane protein MurJ [Bacillota bacterium]